jgi:hypothetical protein
MPALDKMNKQFQNDAPQIHLTKEAINSLGRDIMSRFIKPDILRIQKNVFLINFTDPKNHLPPNSLYFGTEANSLLKELKEKTRLGVIESLNFFYITALTYIKQNFPIDDPLYLHARVINMNNRETALFSDLQFFFTEYPYDLFNGHI